MTHVADNIFFSMMYMFPWIVAKLRGKKDTALLFFVNFLFAWTIFGYFLCLVWACENEDNEDNRCPGKK